MLRRKSATLDLVGDATEGRFTAVVSVFDVVDSYGERVRPGAFAKSLGRWAERGDPIPVVWSHAWGQSAAIIGRVAAARELMAGDPLLPEALAAKGGLWIDAELDVDVNPTAAQVAHLLRTRTVTGMSFAYDVIESEWVSFNGSDVLDLVELDLFEVGPCLVGVNRDAQLVDAKSLAEAQTHDPFARRPTGAGDTTETGKAAEAAEDPAGQGGQAVEDPDGAPDEDPSGKSGDVLASYRRTAELASLIEL